LILRKDTLEIERQLEAERFSWRECGARHQGLICIISSLPKAIPKRDYEMFGRTRRGPDRHGLGHGGVSHKVT